MSHRIINKSSIILIQKVENSIDCPDKYREHPKCPVFALRGWLSPANRDQAIRVIL